MGSYDHTCPITHVAIKSGDPVRFGLITAQNGYHAETPCYACEAYQFWTPLLKAEYNDYGSIEFNTEGLFGWLWGHIAPHVKPLEEHPEYANRSGHSDELERLFVDLIFNNQIYDPDREKRRIFAEENRPVWMCSPPRKFQLWMCHEAAFDKLHDENRMSPQLRQHLDQWIDPKEISADFSWVQGDQGAFDREARWIYVNGRHRAPEGFNTWRDQLLKEVTDTCLFVRKLYDVRKVIRPMPSNGPQQDEYDHAVDWAEWLYKFSKQKREALLEDRN